MTQLVTIELKPLVKIRNWNRYRINPAKYSQTAHGSPCLTAPVVATFSATCPAGGSFCAMAWAMRDSRQIRTFGCVAESLHATASFAAI